MSPEFLTIILNNALGYLGKRFDMLERLLSKSKDDVATSKVFADATTELSRLVSVMSSHEDTGEDLGPVISQNSEAILSVARSMKVQADAVVAELNRKGSKESKAVDILIENSNQLRKMADIFTKHSDLLTEYNEGTHLQNLTEEVRVSLSGIETALKHIDIKAPDVKIEGLGSLESLLGRIDRNTANITMKEVVEALGEVVDLLKKKPEFPKTFKFDADQFRELRALMGQKGSVIVGGGALGGGVSSASTLKSGRKVVAVTNTALAIGTAACQTVFITALTTNSTVVVVGGSDVVATEATRTGKVMYPGDTITISIDNLAKIFINGTANDGVSFTYTR